MLTNKRWRKFIVTLAAAGILAIATSSEPHDALAQASSAQGKFNMSYMYFGNPSSYTSQVDKTGQTLDVVAPSYFHINTDGGLELSDSLLASFIADMHQREYGLYLFSAMILIGHLARKRSITAKRSRIKLLRPLRITI